MQKEPLIFPGLVLTLDDLESAEVPKSVREALSDEQLEKIACGISNKMYEAYHDTVEKICKEMVLTPQNEANGKDISEITSIKTPINILYEMRVDPENAYEVRIYRAALLLGNKRIRTSVYQTSLEDCTVWKDNDTGKVIKIYDDGTIKE